MPESKRINIKPIKTFRDKDNFVTVFEIEGITQAFLHKKDGTTKMLFSHDGDGNEIEMK